MQAGGARSIAQDRASVASLCRRAAEGVVIVAKAWEPPLLEFLDFVEAVRKQCGRRQAIVILLWGGTAPVSEDERRTWELTLRQLKDPDLHVEAIESPP